MNTVPSAANVAMRIVFPYQAEERLVDGATAARSGSGCGGDGRSCSASQLVGKKLVVEIDWLRSNEADATNHIGKAPRT